jgi:hypothetical protein
MRRIGGELDQGERANDREALATKGPGRRSDGCARKSTDPYLGRSRVTPERATRRRGAERSEKSAEAIVAANSANRDRLETSPSWDTRRGTAKGQTEGRANQP